MQNPGHFFQKNIFKYNYAITFSQGQVFGELGLLHKKPRAATVVCLEETHFGVLDVNDYSKSLKKIDQYTLDKKVRFIAQAISQQLSIEKMSKIVYFF